MCNRLYYPGMGLPPVACYLILAVMAAPAIVRPGRADGGAFVYLLLWYYLSHHTAGCHVGFRSGGDCESMQ